jgi:hypothetical protein
MLKQVLSGTGDPGMFLGRAQVICRIQPERRRRDRAGDNV